LIINFNFPKGTSYWRQEKGDWKVIWNGRDDSGKTVSSGIYLYRLKAEKYTKIRKMVLMR